MAEFTPGPWAIHGKGLRKDHTNGGEFVPVLGTNGCGWIADARDSIANAKLIAAAPELLAACIAAIEATGGSQYWNGWTHRFLVLAENALRKAGVDPSLIEAKDGVGPDNEPKDACPECGCEETDHRGLWTCRCPAAIAKARS